MPRMLERARHWMLALGLCLGAASCAAAGQSGRESLPASVLSAHEIESSGAQTAYDAVRKLRANFLSSRGATSVLGTSSSEPTIYLDGTPYGSVETLRNIPASQVAFIRLYRAWEAQTKFGNGNMGGVIDVTTKH